MTASCPPNVMGVPPGADFVKCLFDRIATLSEGASPEKVARINVLVPSRRMQRRLKHLFEQSETHQLLPRVGLVTDVSHLVPGGRSIHPVSSLRRMLELKDVVARLVELDQRLSSADVIDLTASLTALLDEMHSEGVGFEKLEALSPDDHSGHWAQSLGFLAAIRDYVETLGAEQMGSEALHRLEVQALCARWNVSPPDHPTILAGSTGSRATTRLLMKTVAAIPKGEVILPGFDFDLPADIWEMLSADRDQEDHPQYRFAAFLSEIGCDPAAVRQLSSADDPRRNALVSLSLRPAPVTDAWLSEGPELGPLEDATANLSLIEAREPKNEASAIAVAMRSALEHGNSVALIAPDATLSRRVTANLTRWNIRPDDSGGVPLSLSPYGRFLRQTARLASGQADPVEVMALLKHPMTRAGEDRGKWMRRIQEFELYLRKRNVPEVTPEIVDHFGHASEVDPEWIQWLSSALRQAAEQPKATFTDAFGHHMAVIQCFAGEPVSDTTSDAADKVEQVLDRFRAETGVVAKLGFRDYVQLLESALAADSARQQDGVHPDVMIWGSLEARVQGADVIILGGLNEGNWPSVPNADPWLNRAMRRQAGLLLPERQIGLAAHDFEQAIGASEVILTRSARSEGSETVPSRWLSRLVNLLEGLDDSGGKKALAKMKARGDVFLRATVQTDLPTGEAKPTHRPAPSPPIAMRPRRFAVTDIKTLIQDPYAIYAKRILRLRPLDPLIEETDARKRGIVFHKILERFYDPASEFADPEAERQRLRVIAQEVLRAEVSDPVARVEWFGQFNANAEWLISEEARRREDAVPIARETEGEYSVPGTSFMLAGKADRIDRLHSGGLVIYDYKTGTPPGPKDIRQFDRQLVLEAVMAESGAFQDVPAEMVSHVVHVGVGRSPVTRVTELVNGFETVTVSAEIALLLSTILKPEFGFVSGRAIETRRFEGSYDHLARFGEWDTSQDAVLEALT